MARWALLLVAAMLALFVFRAGAPDVQSSALRVLAGALVALAAPLFWPGRADTPVRTALRVLGWSAAAAAAAAIALLLVGGPGQRLPRVLLSCAMLLPVLLLTHAAAAALEGPLRGAAGGTASLALALLGGLPLWFGPAAELLEAGHPGAIDTTLGLSPLTHLAVASGNDLLRNEWLYQHSNLAALQFAYPEPATLAWSYAAACAALALATLAWLRSRRAAGAVSLAFPTPEKTS